MKLEDLLLDSPALKQWFKGIKIKNERHLVTGLLAAAKPLFIASLFKRYQKTILLVSDSLHHAQLLERALSGIVGSDNVYLYPVEEATAAEVAVSSPEYRGERVAALTALCAAEPRIVLASAKGMKRLLPPRAVWQNAKLEFNVGGRRLSWSRLLPSYLYWDLSAINWWINQEILQFEAQLLISIR